MCGSRKFYQRGSNFDVVVFSDDRREDPNITKRGPMMAQHRMLAWLLWDFQGIRTSIAKRPYIFYFSGGGGVQTPCPPSGSSHG